LRNSVSVVISAAGLGARFGMRVPKCVVQVAGKTILEHQIDAIPVDVGVVVVAGYRSDLVIDVVRRARPSAIIALNHEFASTGAAASIALGAVVADQWIISLDGDLLVRPCDMARMIEFDGPCIGIMPRQSQEPVCVTVDEERLHALDLSQAFETPWEWPGLARISRAEAVTLGRGHVFEGLRGALPMPVLDVECFEIDYAADLAIAESWAKTHLRKLG
jgi:choline kinase